MRQPHSLETGRDAFVAVFTRTARPWAPELKPLTAQPAHLRKDHDQSLMLSIGLMVSFELSVAVDCAYG